MFNHGRDIFNVMKRLIASNGMLKTLRDCSTAARLRTDGWSAGEVSAEDAPLRAGSDAHAAFEAWLRGKPTDECLDAFRGRFRGFSDIYLTEDHRLHLSNLERLLGVFFAHNPMVEMPFEFVAAEDQVVMPLASMRTTDLGEVRLCISDKPDGIVRMMDTGDLYAFENKTTITAIGDKVMDDYDLDSQITCHVAVSRYAGYDVKGVWMQVLQFNKLPDPNELTPKTKKPAACRVQGHGLKRDCWPLHVKWVRFPVTRTEEDIEIWRANTIDLLRKYLTVVKESLHNLDQEGIYGKCGRCEFKQFCKGHRRNIAERLVKRVREDDIIYSGLYEE